MRWPSYVHHDSHQLRLRLRKLIVIMHHIKSSHHHASYIIMLSCIIISCHHLISSYTSPHHHKTSSHHHIISSHHHTTSLYHHITQSINDMCKGQWARVVIHKASLPTKPIVRSLTWLSLAKALSSSKITCFHSSDPKSDMLIHCVIRSFIKVYAYI